MGLLAAPPRAGELGELENKIALCHGLAQAGAAASDQLGHSADSAGGTGIGLDSTEHKRAQRAAAQQRALYMRQLHMA